MTVVARLALCRRTVLGRPLRGSAAGAEVPCPRRARLRPRALEAPPGRAIRAQLDDFGGRPLCALIGGGGRTSPDRAARYHGPLVRYLDFNDSYFAAGETCHPSDNLAPVLAAAEYASASGRELLTALAVAHRVRCRLSDQAAAAYSRLVSADRARAGVDGRRVRTHLR